MIEFRLETDENVLKSLFNRDSLLNSSLVYPVDESGKLLPELFLVGSINGKDACIIRLDPTGPRMFNIHVMCFKEFMGRTNTEAFGFELFRFLNTGYGPCLLIANICSKFRHAKRLAKAIGFKEVITIKDGIEDRDSKMNLTILYYKVK